MTSKILVARSSISCAGVARHRRIVVAVVSLSAIQCSHDFERTLDSGAWSGAGRASNQATGGGIHLGGGGPFNAGGHDTGMQGLGSAGVLVAIGAAVNSGSSSTFVGAIGTAGNPNGEPASITVGETVTGGSLDVGGRSGFGGVGTMGGRLVVRGDAGGANVPDTIGAFGGSIASAGRPGNGGANSVWSDGATSGMPNAGGTPSSGGRLSTGGAGAGGTSTTGGSSNSSGLMSTGGIPASGGVPPTGGLPVTGGNANTGGVPLTGGTPSTGGTQAQIRLLNTYELPGTTPEGITWDGSNVWISDNSATLFVLSPAGNLVDSYTAPEATPQGLAWDGSTYWVFATSRGYIHNFSIGGGKLTWIGGISSPATVVGGGITNDMAWDGSSLWFANEYKVTRLSRSGDRLGSFSFAKNVLGIDWDGSHLWLAYRGSSYGVLAAVDTEGKVLATFAAPAYDIEAIAWGSGDRIWSYGRVTSTATVMLLEFGASAAKATLP